MAVDTAVTALSGAPAIGSKVQVYQRTIDLAVNNLASGAWFELFQLEAGDVVLGGAVEVTAVAGAGNEDLTVGIEDGTTLLTATPVDTDGVTAFTNTAGIVVGADTIDLAMTVDAADRGTVCVTAVVLKAGDFAG